MSKALTFNTTMLAIKRDTTSHVSYHARITDTKLLTTITITIPNNFKTSTVTTDREQNSSLLIGKFLLESGENLMIM